jgi:predicted kinase
MCGVSGSGKSYVAERLVPLLPAIRLRSDVLRKHMAGLTSDARSHSALNEGLYGSDQNAQVYQVLCGIAGDLLETGLDVIIDATCLDAADRSRFMQTAADRNADAVVLYCCADTAVLEQRIRHREQAGTDVSEAGIDVLHHQLEHFMPPQEGDQTIVVQTEGDLDLQTLVEKIRRAV